MELEDKACRLEQQNAALQAALQACLDGTTVNDAILALENNSLFIVNQRLQRRLQLPPAGGPPPMHQLLTAKR